MVEYEQRNGERGVSVLDGLIDKHVMDSIDRRIEQ